MNLFDFVENPDTSFFYLFDFFNDSAPLRGQKKRCGMIFQKVVEKVSQTRWISWVGDENKVIRFCCVTDKRLDLHLD